LCLIGPCGCSPENSHQIKTCDCGPDKCFNGNECVSLDEISIVLETIKKETKIVFSEIQPLSFRWVVETDPEIQEVDVEGKGFEVKRISNTQEKGIEFILKSKGFEKDINNIAAGTVVGLTGYIKDQIVCVVVGGGCWV